MPEDDTTDQEHVPKPTQYMQVYHSMMEAGRGVVHQHGVAGLYRGLNITLLEIIPYAALQFGLYDTFTAAWSKARRSRISAKVSKRGCSTFGWTSTCSRFGHHGSEIQCMPRLHYKSVSTPCLCCRVKTCKTAMGTASLRGLCAACVLAHWQS